MWDTRAIGITTRCALAATLALSAAMAAGASDRADILRQAIDQLEERSLHRYEVDWAALRERYRAIEADTPSSDDAGSLVQRVLRDIGDRHGGVFVPQGKRTLASLDVDSAPHARVLATGPGRSNRIGYLRVGAYVSVDRSGIGAHAQTLRAALRQLGRDRPCAYVVDLRGNAGGNMWPMLLGIEPLLDTATPGAFEFADGTREAWHVFSSAAGFGSEQAIASPDAWSGYLRDRPLAVLIDGRVASSGEAVALAFVGRPGTVFVGEATAGFTTANDGFELPGGRYMTFETARMLDRTGTFHDRVMPDIVAGGRAGASGSRDAMLQAAVRWAGSQCGR